MIDKKLPWDSDADYPGLFLLLVNENHKVCLLKAPILLSN